MQTVTAFGQQSLTFIPNLIGQILNYIAIAVGLWSLVELGFMRGNLGENNHGRDPSA